MNGLAGKVAVVTGGGRGIGRGIALRLAREGMDVAVNYGHSREQAEEVCQEIAALGRRAEAIEANLSTAAGAEGLIEEAARRFGRFDVLVNNAGGGVGRPFLETTEEDYDRILDLNLKWGFFASQAFAAHLVAARAAGTVVNVSSVHEEIPFPGHAAYSAAKAGVKLLTRDLAVELGRHRITVNAVAPGAIETEANAGLMKDESRLGALLHQIPLGRFGRPEDVAGVVAFLASDDAAYVTGSTYFVDGGLTWFYQE